MLPLPAADAPKVAWRRWAKAVRGADPEAQRDRRSASLLSHLRAWDAFVAAEHVLIYLAFGHELSLDGLFDPSAPGGDPSHADTWRLYGPRTRDADDLTVHALQPGRFEVHRLGFRQPRAQAPRAPLDAIDIALVPGLAFDRRGTRLGYGMGFYDRLLPNLRPDALRVGVCAAPVRVDALPRDPHDAPMTHLATDDGIVAVDA